VVLRDVLIIEVVSQELDREGAIDSETGRFVLCIDGRLRTTTATSGRRELCYVTMMRLVALPFHLAML